MAIDARVSSDGTKIEIVNDSDDSVIYTLPASLSTNGNLLLVGSGADNITETSIAKLNGSEFIVTGDATITGDASIAGAQMSYDASGPKVRIDVGTGSKKQTGIYLDSDGHLNNQCPILLDASVDVSDIDVVSGDKPSWGVVNIDTAPTGYGLTDSDSYKIPKDGYYEIHLSLLQHRSTVGSIMSILLHRRRNGQGEFIKRMLYHNGPTGTYEQVSNMAYVELQKGDIIDVRSSATRGWWGSTDALNGYLSSWKMRYLGAQE